MIHFGDKDADSVLYVFIMLGGLSTEFCISNEWLGVVAYSCFQLRAMFMSTFNFIINEKVVDRLQVNVFQISVDMQQFQCIWLIQPGAAPIL